MQRFRFPFPTLLAVVGCLLTATASEPASAGDWPTWRADSHRTASTPDSLPADLTLHWTRDLPEPKPCWPFTQYKLQFDRSYEPVVQGKRLFISSMVEDSVAAYDAESGEELWKTFVDGPVRFAPAAWEDRLYFVSDDGHLYCADQATGNILWKVRGGPADNRVFGNERLVSMWPARGGAVVYDGTVYFAASIWPFMGVFIHAVDAKSGEIVWTNSGSSSSYILQPHSSPAFAGIAPQGYLAATEDKLFIAGGRSVPAVYDRKTGDLIYYDANTKYGGYEIAVAGDHHCSFGVIFDSADGKPINFQFARAAVTENERVIESQMPIRPEAMGNQNEGMIRSVSLNPEWTEFVDNRGRTQRKASFPIEWEIRRPIEKVFLRAGTTIICGTTGLIAAVEQPAPGTGVGDGEDKSPAPMVDEFRWKAEIEGTPFTAIAAADRLFVVTEAGRIYCFGSGNREVAHHQPSPTAPAVAGEYLKRADEILGAASVDEGYGILLGAGSGQLAEALVAQSKLHLVVFEPDAEKVEALRRRWSTSGLYGARIALVPSRIHDAPLSPHFALFIASEEALAIEASETEAFAKRVFETLRPYGGRAMLTLDSETQARFKIAIENLEAPNAQLETADNATTLTKVGPLPGSAPWTHKNSDVANSVFSRDHLVKTPLGLLWFGGPSHLDVLPRHGHGPPQLIVGGRLFIQGIHVLSARDVFTGKVLWRKELPDLNTFGMYYNETYVDDPYDLTYNQRHIPGSNQYGSNFVVTEDSLYLASEKQCLVIDPTNGETVKTFELPEMPAIGKPNWGYIGVHGDILLAGAAPFDVDEKGEKIVVQTNNRYGVGSKYLVGLNRHTGEHLWIREAEVDFRHNTIVAGGDRVFCMDSASPKRAALLRRRGLEPESNGRILSLNIQTGETIWETSEKVFGTWLGYSVEHDVVFQGGSSSGDRARDEVREGMAAYSGSDGSLLWSNEEMYNGPCILRHDWVITQTGGSNTSAPPAMAFHIKTGERIMVEHPITGEPTPWGWVRFKGCNTAVACENLLTFRSASAAFVDLNTGHGTSTIGGFRSGCSSNLIAAEGILNAPDYTRTCTCAYQNQTSLALVHMPEGIPGAPEIEEWSFNFYKSPETVTPIRKVGVNLGAPGDRSDSDGLLWLEFPSVGGPSPDLAASLEVEEPNLYRHHSSLIERSESDDASPPWVAASGVEGEGVFSIQPYLFPAEEEEKIVDGFARNAHEVNLLTSLDLPANAPIEKRNYTLRLHFAETLGAAPGERVFDVLVQGKVVLDDFDVVREARGPNRGIVREIPGVEVADKAVIELRRSNPEGGRKPILSGVELIQEGKPKPLGS